MDDSDGQPNNGRAGNSIVRLVLWVPLVLVTVYFLCPFIFYIPLSHITPSAYAYFEPIEWLHEKSPLYAKYVDTFRDLMW